MILLDSNILVDLRDRDELWSGWTRERLSRVPADEEVAVNSVVLAETVRHFRSSRDQVQALRALGIGVLAISPQAGWLAGQAHQAYRRAGGPRSAVLADFLIGGHLPA